MARLTTFSRLLIVLVVLVGVFFAVRNFLPGFGSSDDKTTTTEQPTREMEQETNDPAPNQPKQTDNSGSSTTASFDYLPPAPVNGKLKGVVEVGATGFNSFIVSIDGQKNWKLEKAEFGVSLVKEGLASEEDVKSGLKRYISEMVAYGVPARDIHFVVSSGAQKEPIMPKINAALKGMGYYVNVVTPEQEARYALKSALPRDYNNSGYVVDIGSGNTKISWLPSGAIEAPGAKYYQNKMSAEAVFAEVKRKASNVPAKLRNTCFIIGGVPFELAKQTRNGKERYTTLKAPSDYKAEGAKQEAGLNIYAALKEGTGTEQFVFDWDANFTIGFLLNL